MHGEFGAVQTRGEVVGEGAIGGVGNEFEGADRLSAQGQVTECGIGLQLRIVEDAEPRTEKASLPEAGHPWR